jgi:hypothetical protein
MKKLLGVLVVLALVGSFVVAASPVKTYQVTGPVLEVTPTSVVVQKGTDKWELARDASTQVTGDLKVGAKVVIEYRMIATTIAVKEVTPPAPPKKK